MGTWSPYGAAYMGKLKVYANTHCFLNDWFYMNGGDLREKEGNVHINSWAGHTARHAHTSKQAPQLLKGRSSAGENKAVHRRSRQTSGCKLLPIVCRFSLVCYSLALFITHFQRQKSAGQRTWFIMTISDENICIKINTWFQHPNWICWRTEKSNITK